jgi:hypothetical protein
MTFASKLAVAGMGEGSDSAPIIESLFGATAHTAIETCALAGGAFDHVGVQLTSKGEDVVVSMFSSGKTEEKSGVVNMSAEITMLHEIARWPLPEVARWKQGSGKPLGAD